ncbi:MAG: ABC transporter ATP-binding protein [Chitinophagales bacterium]
MIGIVAENIFKKYKGKEEIVLNELTFELPQGEKIGILGPNGAGKTTLISIICGILEPNTGKISYLENQQTLSYDTFKSRLGFVPQELALYQELTPIQNLNYFGTMYGMPKKEIQEKSIEILDALGLLKVKDKKASTFSGGMKRRLNLAISILHNPKILFLDEPTVGIDVQSKNAIISLLQKINEKGTTIIYTSHHLKEAETLCDKVLLIDKGDIIAYDSIENLKVINKLDSLEEIFLALTGIEYRD